MASPYPAAPKNNGLALAGFVVSMLSLLMCTAAVTGPVGLVLSAVGLVQINKSNGTQGGKGLAIAGVVIGGIFTAIVVVYLVIIVAASSSSDFQ